MADTDIIVSEMTQASQINTGDLMIMTQPDAQAETGYTTKSGTVLQVANKMLKGTDYATDLPDFTDQSVLGGMEELKSDIKALLPIDTATGNPCTFDTDLADNLVSVNCAIVASGGGGTPSTPIPIVGYSSLNLTHNGTTDTIALGSTVYGGELDVTRRVLTITWGCIDLEDESIVWTWNNIWFQTESIPNIKYVSLNTQVGNALAEEYTIRMASGMSYAQVGECAIDVSNVKFVTTNSSTKPCGLFAYELATPQTVQLTPTQVQAIVGTNNISSDTNGDVTCKYKVSIQKYIDDKVAQLQALIL